MFARLTALVGSGPGLPFDLQEAHPSAWGPWTHYRATMKADGSAVSVFKVWAHTKDDPRLMAARNGVKRLRMVRVLLLLLACSPCSQKLWKHA